MMRPYTCGALGRHAKLIAVACVTIMGVNPVIADNPELKFRGVGITRQSLDAMHLKPFDQNAWQHLSSWSTPTQPESAGGKVTVIVTWAAWRTPSHPAMRTAQSVWAANKDQDLLVVGVHNPRGFEGAKANADALGITFPYAADSDGKFRQAIKADSDPNVYVIDRAGQLRYAQLDPSSLQEAVASLLAETVEQAKAIPDRLAADRLAADRERRRTGDAMAAGPSKKVEFKLPDEDAYNRVKWPYLVGKVERDKILESISNTPPVVTLAEDNWFPSKPDTNGKLVAMYVFDPIDTDLLNVVPIMNNIATKYWSDVTVVGQTAKIGEAVMNVSGEELNKLIERNARAIQTLIAQNRANHPLQASPFKGEQFESEIPLFGLQRGRRSAGTVLVMSTDNKVRWMGDPHSEVFRRALDELIALDPGVQARRAAEKKAGGK